MENVGTIDRKRGLIFSAFLLFLMTVISAYAWLHLPNEARIPVHWGISGQPDRFGEKSEALLLGPVLTLFLSLLFAFLPNIEPRKSHLLQSAKAYYALWFSVLLVMLGVHVMIVGTALGFNILVIPTVGLCIGTLFMVIGNFMGKIRSNFFFGIRTPWTLSSELSWSKTHRVGGWLFCLSGLSIMLSSMLNNGLLCFAVLFATSFINVLSLTVYSYVIWKADLSRSSVAK
jgi:uncharacterized membrane protein